MIRIIITSLAVSLALTLFIEVLLAVILGIRSKEDILLVVLCNILTNPAVVFLSILASIYTGKTLYILSTAFLELLAFTTEGFIYHSFLGNKKYHPFVLSFILNLASFLTGVVISFIGGRS